VFAIAVVLGASVLTTLFLTPVARSAAIAMGVVAKPRSTRWHKRPTALLGGVAIVVGTGVGLATATLLIGDGWALHSGTSSVRAALGIGLSAALMFLVGLVDDIAPLRAQAKFLFQLLAGVILLSLDAVLPLSPSYVANVVITLFWFVAVTNAFNLLDGLDGVAAGVGAIAAFFLGLTFARQGAWWHASIAWSIAGATIGFLRYNFHPASIFMGDAGSLFLGSVLAGLVVSSPGAGSASVVSVLFVPLAIVAVPLVDTTLVTITRLLAGRPISEGGLDHSTYRLVALGLSERQVAVLLYAFAMTGGLVGTWLTRLDRGLGLLLGTSFLVAMSLLAAYLGRMQIAHVSNVRKAKPVTLLVRNLLYKRRLAELLLDVVLIALAYYGAYRLRFDNVLPLPYAEAFEATIGLVIATKVAALVAFGVYRGAWEYASIFDLYRVIGAVLVAGLGIFLYAEWRVPTLAASHSIVYIDVLLTAALILTSRLSFRSLEMLRERLQVRGERVLIYGAGDGGELILRELRNHHELQLRPVCFLDDDLRRHGTQIHGVPVVGGFDSLGVAARRFGVNKIVIGTKELSVEGVRAITAVAEGLGLEVAEVAFGVKWIPTIGMQDDVSSPSVEERQAV
jgi:UDP-GlcNAc:undecaprenyl-phosphate/decaprenyl-phosphate GlcNAc-1-phosphate transferase